MEHLCALLQCRFKSCRCSSIDSDIENFPDGSSWSNITDEPCTSFLLSADFHIHSLKDSDKSLVPSRICKALFNSKTYTGLLVHVIGSFQLSDGKRSKRSFESVQVYGSTFNYLLGMVWKADEVHIMGQRAFDLCHVTHYFIRLVGSIIVPPLVMVGAFATL